MKNIARQVFCTLQFEAVHCWATCPLPEVDFLRVPHRHMFHVKAFVDVTHDDRDVEFILLKRQISDYINAKYPVNAQGYRDIGTTSCEMLALDLINQFNLSSCEVNEDGENGAVLKVVS